MSDTHGFEVGDRVEVAGNGRPSTWTIQSFFPGQGNTGGTNAVLVLEGRRPSIYTTITVTTNRLKKAAQP
jgi:hypothetical protein